MQSVRCASSRTTCCLRSGICEGKGIQLKRLLEFFQRTYKTKRTVVYECPLYLHGIYSFTSWTPVSTKDIVAEVMNRMPVEAIAVPFLERHVERNIRIMAVY